MLGKQKHEKKMWSDNYYQKQVALAGKFTFPTSVPLDNNEKGEDGKPVAADQISLINLKDVRFSYDVSTGHFIFNDPISFNVLATTRCGVMGPNGAGKSTLLKLLTHKLIPTSGTVTHHPKFTLAYFGQHSTAELNLEQTPIEFMGSQFPEESAGTLRQHLAKTSVVGTTADTRMHRLSFSQRSCVIFSKLTFVCPHLLIMDEPTNFLDLESVDALIAACNKYKGALLLVSHNRDFLKKCAKQYLSVVPGSFKMYDNLKVKHTDTRTHAHILTTTQQQGSRRSPVPTRSRPAEEALVVVAVVVSSVAWATFVRTSNRRRNDRGWRSKDKPRHHDLRLVYRLLPDQWQRLPHHSQQPLAGASRTARASACTTTTPSWWRTWWTARC